MEGAGLLTQRTALLPGAPTYLPLSLADALRNGREVSGMVLIWNSSIATTWVEEAQGGSDSG